MFRYSSAERIKLTLPSLAAVLAILCGALTPAFSQAAMPSAGWAISSMAEPSNFSAAQNVACEATPNARRDNLTGDPCDTYTVIARNIGSAASSGPVTISDILPEGIEAKGVTAEELQSGAVRVQLFEGEACGLPRPQCTYTGAIAPGGALIMTVNAIVKSGVTGTASNAAEVEGGGGASVVTTPATGPANTIEGALPQFALEGFYMTASGLDGNPDTQAGGHPYAVSTGFSVPNFLDSRAGNDVLTRAPVQQLKSIAVDLPLGLIGNPQSVPRCRLAALAKDDSGNSECPPASRIGVASVELGGGFGMSNMPGGAISSIYNMVPETGYPAEFGFTAAGFTVILHAEMIRKDGAYALRVSSPGVPTSAELGIDSVSLTFFGDPSAQDGGASGSAFLTNPTTCTTDEFESDAQATSWEQPSRWVQVKTEVSPKLSGCDLLQFTPTVEVQPTTTTADRPSGYEVDLSVPQPENFAGLSTPELKDASVTLPDGVSISPPAGDGLAGCEATGPAGIDVPRGTAHPDEAGEGEEIGPDGFTHLAEGHCPDGSAIGTVEIQTPLLANALTGHVYVAQPSCGGAEEPECSETDAEEGRLFALYIEAKGPGVDVKLPGVVEVGGYGPHSARTGLQPGQLRAKFVENPQFPFSLLRLVLEGGSRAALANPQAWSASCATGALTTSDLVSWSTPFSPDATPSWKFPLSGCSAEAQLQPGFLAQTSVPVAGTFTPLTFTITRNDGEQNLTGVQLRTPPGLLGMIASVPLCAEAQANAGTCAQASRIATVWAAAGSGPRPLWLSGPVYITQAYHGAPFGLSIVVPAKAGPFNLGDVVLRATVSVDPHDAHLIVTSDPLPQMRDGVPIRLKEIHVVVDRSDFIFNPTNCSRNEISAAITGSSGTSASVSTPFAVTGCRKLKFGPKLDAVTSAKTSRKMGASLDTKLTYPQAPFGSQANIRTVKVDLPRQLIVRLSTLQQACPAKLFDNDPASCPVHSVVGSASAVTPTLSGPLTGPVYFVSHGGEAFPQLVMVLQREGVTTDLVGDTFISKTGVTSTTFRSVPDVPVSSFELTLPQGRYSALSANGALCKATHVVTTPKRVSIRLRGRTKYVMKRVKEVRNGLVMPTAFVGQNGSVIHQDTTISVSGCSSKDK
jgi:hypothetical protein